MPHKCISWGGIRVTRNLRCQVYIFYREDKSSTNNLRNCSATTIEINKFSVFDSSVS